VAAISRRDGDGGGSSKTKRVRLCFGYSSSYFCLIVIRFLTRARCIDYRRQIIHGRRKKYASRACVPAEEYDRKTFYNTVARNAIPFAGSPGRCPTDTTSNCGQRADGGLAQLGRNVHDGDALRFTCHRKIYKQHSYTRAHTRPRYRTSQSKRRVLNSFHML